MKPHLLLFIIPSLYGTIDVYISGNFHSNFTIQATGTDRAIVTDTERTSFNVSDGTLKDCVKNYLGGKPNDAFIHGPTPWGDLYKTYGWIQTFRILAPSSNRIVSIASSPQLLKHIENNDTTLIKLRQTIYNRFSTAWISPELSVATLKRHVDVDNFNLTYASALGVNAVKLKGMTTGLFLGDLDFGSAVIELYATRVAVKIEVVYKAFLWGNIVLNYDKAFRGHHFYSPNLEDIMFDCGLSNSLDAKEIIDIWFYTDAKVVVRNKSTGNLLMTQNVDIDPL